MEVPERGWAAGCGVSGLVGESMKTVEKHHSERFARNKAVGLFLMFTCFPGGSVGKESTHNVGNLGLIPRLGGSPGEGNGCPLQYSGLENPMGCIVHRVTKSQTRLRDLQLTSFSKVSQSE